MLCIIANINIDNDLENFKEIITSIEKKKMCIYNIVRNNGDSK